MKAQAEEREPEVGVRRLGAGLVAVRAARKVLIASVGGAVCVVGVVLLPLPGPGMLVIILGLTILSTEYHWPRRVIAVLRRRAARVAAVARQRALERRSRNRDGQGL